MVLIWAAAATLIIGGVIMAASQRLQAVEEVTRADFSAHGQAKEIAGAGLVDAYAWFRRQQVQPVTTFAPALNLSANPVVNETDDPTIGLVRTFEVSPGLWARYEVRKGVAAEPYTDSNHNGWYDVGEPFTDTNGDGRWSPGRETRDVTAARGLTGSGTVWQIVSHAMMYRRPQASLPLGQGLNIMIAQATLAAEVRRLTLVPPAVATLCSSKSASVTVATRGRIRSDGTCIAYGTNNGSAVTTGGELIGPTTITSVSGWKDDVPSVFGVDWPTLQSMADISTTDPVHGLPAQFPTMNLIVVTGDVTFDQNRPLRGTEVLVVKGNVTITDGSNSFFSGMLYVDGNLTVRAPALLRGTVVCRGTIDIRGTGGDYAELEHDAVILSKLMTVMGQYRTSKAPFEPSRWLTDGRPDETAAMRLVGGM